MLGVLDGTQRGPIDGDALGCFDGEFVTEGMFEGLNVGAMDGAIDGTALFEDVGTTDGDFVGCFVGVEEGLSVVGGFVGPNDEMPEVGLTLGKLEGETVGEDEGENVGDVMQEKYKR